jgi:hypothetical protein
MHGRPAKTRKTGRARACEIAGLGHPRIGHLDRPRGANPTNAAEAQAQAQAQPKYPTLATKPSLSIPIPHRDSPLTAISFLTRSTHPPPPPPPPLPPAVASMRGHGPVAYAAVVRIWASTPRGHGGSQAPDPAGDGGHGGSSTLSSPTGHGTHLIPSPIPTYFPRPDFPQFHLVTAPADSLGFYVRRRELQARFCWAAAQTKAAGRREAA